MKITVFGAGYVGLVTGICMADVGHHVLCVDVDPDKIAGLARGEIPIHEPGLEAMLRRNLAAGRVEFSTDLADAVEFGELLFIAVGTPPGADGAADLGQVRDVARAIGRHLSGYKVVVNKSTVPVGTAEEVHGLIEAGLRERGRAIAFDVCSNPEFLKEGAAIDDFTRGSRIVVGTASENVRQKMRECYAPYNRNHDKLMFMDVRAAELTKYAANAMLATRISFINEIANLAERLGVDIEQVRLGIGSDPRIGYHFIYPGCGYGGSCLPKDVRALVHAATSAGYDAKLLAAVDAVNGRQKHSLYEKLHRAFEGRLANRTIAVWGLAFKPETDDMREAPSRALLEALWDAGARVRAYDPVAMPEAARLYPRQPLLELVDSREAAVREADALVICSEWKQFRTLDFHWLARQLRHPVVVDGRNLYDPASASAARLHYYAIGRGDSLHAA